MSTATDPQLDSLVGALVDANDQLLALYELASLSVDTLDEATAVVQILSRAHKLLKTDSLALLSDPVRLVGESEMFDPLLAANDAETLEQLRASTREWDTVSIPVGWTIAMVAVAAGEPFALVAARKSKPFGTADQKLLHAVAKLLAGVINTAQLHTEALEQAVIGRDHLIASELAQRALPDSTPQVPGVDVYARSDPAHTSGGDLYAWSVVDGVLHFVMGDVAGKGLPAAITMTNVISAANASFRLSGSKGPAAILASMDEWLCESLTEREVFVTMLVGSYDPESETLTVANAGHSPVLYVSDGKVMDIAAHHPPVGVLPIEELLETAITVCDGDVFLAGSDGLTEQQDPSGTMFGDDRVVDLVSVGRDLSAADLGARIFNEVENFAMSASQSDDRTLVCLTFGKSK